MAIKINLSRTDGNLFAASKWWGDPDMPAEMQYPMLTLKEEDGEEYEYPMTFVCQLNCEELARFDAEHLLPREGMLYFFAAIDEYTGYDAPYHNGVGEWPRKSVVVKYARQINMETFESYVMTDEDDEPLTAPALKISLEECADDDPGIRILGNTAEGCVNMLQLVGSEIAGLDLEGRTIQVMADRTDLEKAVYKRVKTVMSE